MRCRTCGREIGKAKYCRYCGAEGCRRRSWHDITITWLCVVILMQLIYSSAFGVMLGEWTKLMPWYFFAISVLVMFDYWRRGESFFCPYFDDVIITSAWIALILSALSVLLVGWFSQEAICTFVSYSMENDVSEMQELHASLLQLFCWDKADFLGWLIRAGIGTYLVMCIAIAIAAILEKLLDHIPLPPWSR